MKEFIKKIKNKEVREATELVVDNLPEYFYKIPASSSGKYHPSFSLGEGGLYRHVKFATEVALNLFNIIEFSTIEKDIIISSILLHDGLKQGLKGTGHTVKTHDDLMAKHLTELWKDDFEGREKIINCVKSHMGQWCTTRKPIGKLEKFVHTCDYLASRKFYDKYYNIKN